VVWDVLETYDSVQAVATHLHTALADFCYRTMRRRPMILPLVVEL
jgi:mRNA degradation ribonuclease J1/J2